MKAKDLRERSATELVEMEQALRKELFTARMKNHTNQLEKTSEMPRIRRDVARVLSVLKEKAQ